MTSSDKQEYVTVEMFNGGIQEIKSEIATLNKRIDGIQTEIKDTRNELLTEIRLNQNDVAHLQTSVYWGFAIIGVIIAFVSLYPFGREKPETSEDLSPRNIRDIRALIHEEFSILSFTRTN